MRLAKNGYITYLRNPEQHTNAAASYAGMGATASESMANAQYYNNQAPWVVTVRWDDAPRWAQEQAEEARRWEQEMAAQAPQRRREEAEEAEEARRWERMMDTQERRYREGFQGCACRSTRGSRG